MRDYCYGDQFKYHPLFSVNTTALQIMLYYDELETCNPLGSRATKHKIGNYIIRFYILYTMVNMLSR